MNHEMHPVRWLATAMLMLPLIACGSRLLAGGGPENVAVVVNADSWASKTIANEYRHLRGISPANVIHLNGLPDFQTVDVDTFRERILLPVMKTLYERGVLLQVDCIAYSSDLPTAIDVSADFSGENLPEYQTTVASINGLTYLYQRVLAKRPGYLKTNVNYYRRRPMQELASGFPNREDLEAYRRSAHLHQNKQWKAASEILQSLATRLKSHARLHYNLACCLSRLGRQAEALESLSQAVQAGWNDRKTAETDPDLVGLRDSTQFKTLLAKMDQRRHQPFTVQPTTAFSSQYQWNPRGERVRTRGMRYMLSTVLAVTSGRGNSVREALESLRRSALADGTVPEGTVYFMKNDDVRGKVLEPSFKSAAKALENTPLEGRIETGVLPKGQDDVTGAMIDADEFSWRTCRSEILPGTICAQLNRCGSLILESDEQTPLTEFARYGAAGASGTVTEPYSVHAKSTFPFVHVHYARGCSLAEALYQSVSTPYQVLIVGDPVCQPWAKPLAFKLNARGKTVSSSQSHEVSFSEKPSLSVTLEEEPATQDVTGELEIEPVMEPGDGIASRLDHFEIYIDGRRHDFEEKGSRLVLDVGQLGGGWHELAVVAVAQGPTEARSRVVLPLIVEDEHGGIELALAGDPRREILYGEMITVRGTMSLRATMTVVANGYPLGTIEGPEGTMQIDSRQLGIGPVRLQAKTQVAGKPTFSAPLDLHVTPPEPIPARDDVDDSELETGIMITCDGTGGCVVRSTCEPAWLPKREWKTGQRLTIKTLFSAPEADLYQFQFRGNLVSRILVDGHVPWQLDNDCSGGIAWTMVPVNLAKGWHRFELEGVIPQSPRLEIRFGNRGCTSLDGERFKHKPEWTGEGLEPGE